MAGDKRVRPWSFWRKAFWTRPGLLVVYAVAALLFVPVGVHQTIEAVGAGRAVSAHRLCEDDHDGPCLEQASGTLRGPFSVRRSVNDDYRVADSNEVQVGPRASSALEPWSGTEVTTLTYDGDVVVIETPDGGSFSSVSVGARGTTQWVAITLLALGGAAGLGRYARRKSRAHGGWWRVEGPPVDATDLRVAFAVAVPGLCLFGMLLGAAWWVAIAATVVLVSVALLAVARPWRRQL